LVITVSHALEVADLNRQVNAHAGRTFKAQWLSGLKLRLIDIEHKFEEFSQIRAYSLKAQWLSGLKLRLNDLFEAYSTVRG
nr:hypothetical protein [Globicatella sanguinis]